MNISIEIPNLDKVLANFAPQVIRGALFRAINRTVDGVATDVNQETRQTYNIRRDDLSKRIKKHKMKNYDSLNGSVEIQEKADGKSAMPLILFRAIGRKNLAGGGSVRTKRGKDGYISERLKRAGASGVTYKVLKQGGKGKSDKAFIIPGGGGSLQVVVRRQGVKGDKGLQEKRVFSPMHMVRGFKHGVMDRIKKQGQERFMRNVLHELKRYQDRVNSGLSVGR